MGFCIVCYTSLVIEEPSSGVCAVGTEQGIMVVGQNG